ncbi:uncharacterized protein [Centruroides vittatus]|uniref:uncharacterized protein n=1 Tax=Centruroides vittatus TaxID=120091 RepID=UPI00350F5729
MRLENNNSMDGVIWRCSTGRVCRKQASIRKFSFFSGSHIEVFKILQLMYLWAYEVDKQDFLQRELEIRSAHTIVDWKQFCRDICHEYFLLNPIVLGGRGHTVEIDESCFVRRKYERGHRVREQWVFGDFDVETKESFLVTVDRRDAGTLLPILQQFVLPGTTVVSDLWAAYNTVENVGYQHLTVNHSINFVDPLTHATTNHVESVWQKAKEKNKRRFSTHRTMLDNYSAGFLWCQRFQKDAFHNLVEHVRLVYPEAAQ